jgi:beta-galactosidase
VLEAKAFAGAPPAWPKFAALPAAPQRQPAELAPQPATAPAPKAGQVGVFTKAFNYSGPSAYLVHIETNAQNGRPAYSDGDSPFRDLPAELVGADWMQAANKDALYHAVDLIELTANAGSTVAIAHDDRLPRPPWLVKDYRPGAGKLIVLGRPMTLFTRPLARETSLTLGPNTEDSTAKAANMYLVFVYGSK